jgi:integrase/recombinase XerD
MDDLVDREYAAGSKRWLPALRDSIAFKVCYACGLRRREVTMLDLHDFGPNPHVPAYGEFGAVTIRWAKGTAGSGPRRRTVLTVPEFEWVVDLLKFWIHEGGRDRFPTADRSAALWPSERPIGSHWAASVTPLLPRATPLACPRSSACTACATPHRAS